jgi:uncharacterized protein (DUF2141 family)
MRLILLGVVALFLCFNFENCANKAAPQGGPKDTLAPYVVSALPALGGKNFQGNVIVLRFNEWIKDNSLQKELLITPPIKEYEPKVIRDRVEIRLKSPLQPNTTYSLNFRKGIADITESNIAVTDTLKRLPLRLAFSTGAFLDSLEVAGKVLDMMSNTQAKTALVALYLADDTLKVRKHPPYYFTQTDEKGAFKVTNLKAGKYLVYAIQDNDQSFSFQPTEAIGFLEKPLNLPDTSKKEIILKVWKDDHKPAEIQKSRAVGTEYEIVWNEYLRSVKATFPNKEALPYSLSLDRKTTRFFNPQALKDSIKVQLEAVDSLGNKKNIETTIGFKPPTDSRKKAKPTPLAVKVKSHAPNGFEEEVALDFEFEQPVRQALLENIMVLADKDTLKKIPLCQTDTAKHYTWNEMRTVLTIKRKAFFKDRITILADSGTFIGVKGDSSKNIKEIIALKKVEDLASIGGNIRTEKKAFFLQLINEKNEVVREVRNVKSFNFQYLQGGTYKFRVLIDENENGVWDRGNLDKMLPPEPVLFFELQNEGKLRDKWDLQGHNIAF